MAEQAYLVIREGTKWSDVFRLAPGDAISIGRDPSNQIVIKDERSSRIHAELFMLEGRWVLRDLGSRNGTAVGKKLIKGDWTLRRGDVIRIGHSRLVFAYDLSEAFADPTGTLSEVEESVEARAGESPPNDSSVLSAYEPTTITHRRGQTRFLSTVDRESEVEGEVEGVSRTNRATARLCRLAFDLGKAPDLRKLADLALAGLLEGANVDAGALLLLPRDFSGEASGADLKVFASQTTGPGRYHPVASFLATTVMREGEAVLARNIMGDSSLGGRDSKGVIHATSVICAPVRHGKKVLGLIHLYSSSLGCIPDPDDLEFTLAVADTVAVAIANLNRRRELAEDLTQVRNENLQLRQQLGVQSEIVGSSAMMRQVAEEIARAAASKATLLIRGESGVGKELVARAVHYSSSRSKKVFVCLNCAALSEDLLASELFGHERGAFTGATDRKIGKFEAAHRGTLMLDEIGEMSPGIQAKFLRVLEGHPFERVGGNKPVKVEVRVIAATNRDLEKDVAAKRFRHDLFFRLRVLEIVVPPLRKRPDDVAELALYFLEMFRSETGRKIRGFSPSAMEMLTGYRWPGNVRELKNVVERAVVLCRSENIERGDLLLSSLSTSGDTGEATAAGQGFQACSISELERKHILATLNHVGWNKSRTAGILGIERSTLDRKIRRYKLVNERGTPGRGKGGNDGPPDVPRRNGAVDH